MIKKFFVMSLASSALFTSSALLATSAMAAEHITATLTITLSRGNSVATQMNGQYTCHQGFEVGVPKSLTFKVPQGQYVQVIASQSCYTSEIISGVKFTTDQEEIFLDL